MGLGLLYLGKQERADVMLEAVRTVEHKRGRYAEITLNTCAYAGTGNVLKVNLLSQYGVLRCDEDIFDYIITMKII